MNATVVNLRDLRGQSLPAGTVRIDRYSKWGNPFHIGERRGMIMSGEPIQYTRADVIRLYRAYLDAILAEQPDYLEPLRGQTLACWCAPEPCHGDVIVEALATVADRLRRASV